MNLATLVLAQAGIHTSHLESPEGLLCPIMSIMSCVIAGRILCGKMVKLGAFKCFAFAYVKFQFV